MNQITSALLKTVLASGVTASMLLATIPSPALAQSTTNKQRQTQRPAQSSTRPARSYSRPAAAPITRAPQWHPAPTYVRSQPAPVTRAMAVPVHRTFTRTMQVNRSANIRTTTVRRTMVTPSHTVTTTSVRRNVMIMPVHQTTVRAPVRSMTTTRIMRNPALTRSVTTTHIMTSRGMVVTRRVTTTHIVAGRVITPPRTVTRTLVRSRTQLLSVRPLPRVVASHVVYLPRVHRFVVYHPAYVAGRIVRVSNGTMYVASSSGQITRIIVRDVRLPSRIVVLNRYVAVPVRYVNSEYVYYTGTGYNGYVYDPSMSQWYTYNPYGAYSAYNPYQYASPYDYGYNPYPNYGYSPYGYPTTSGGSILSDLLLGAVISYALPALLGQNGNGTSSLLSGLLTTGLVAGLGGNGYGYNPYGYNPYAYSNPYAYNPSAYNPYAYTSGYAPTYSTYNPDEYAYNPYSDNSYNAYPAQYSAYAVQPAYAPYGTPLATAQVQGVIMASSGSTLMVIGQNGVTPILINATPAIQNGYTNGPLVPGRVISAYGYYQPGTNTFIATALM